MCCDVVVAVRVLELLSASILLSLSYLCANSVINGIKRERYPLFPSPPPKKLKEDIRRKDTCK